MLLEGTPSDLRKPAATAWQKSRTLAISNPHVVRTAPCSEHDGFLLAVLERVQELSKANMLMQHQWYGAIYVPVAV